MGETRPGTVYLIGAGPGDPGLLTVRGLHTLQAADVIIYDYLVDPAIVRQGRADAEYIYVGKQAGQHTLEQDEINDLLVRHARAGRVVARLKGGDPFVFGRGGEEAERLAAEGIPWEVVPGISSAIAAPAYAGIPVTQRGMAAAFTVVTGHEDPTKEISDIDWASLGAGTGTLIFLMGVGNLTSIAERLIAHGRAPATPVAVIRWGTTPRQEVVSGTLADIAERVCAVGLKPPAVTLVGPVAALRERLAWFDRRPLWGKRVIITRASEQAPELAERLAALGAQTTTLATIQIAPADPAPLDAAVRAVSAGMYQWVIFTSVNGVAAYAERLAALDLDARALAARVGAIGPATAAALRARGIRPDFVPTEYVAEAVAEQIGDIAEQSILLPRADIARPALAELLRAKGAWVHELAAYRTIAPPLDPAAVIQALHEPRPDAITFTSSSTVRGFVSALGGRDPATALAGIVVACIGPITAATAREYGITPEVVATEYTMDGLVAALQAALTDSQP
jgi:uroporphyrinogen III methyltransferase/synthase